MTTYAGNDLAFSATYLFGAVEVPALGTDPASSASYLTGGTFAPFTGTCPITIPDPDLLAPEITDVDPAPGTTLEPSDVVSFSIADETEIGFVEVQVDQSRREVVHDGDAFLYPYHLSTRDVIAGGWRYHVQRLGGWEVGPVFKVRVFDTAMNEGV